MVDWSQYKVQEGAPKTDWSQYKVMEEGVPLSEFGSPMHFAQQLAHQLSERLGPVSAASLGTYQGLGDIGASVGNIPAQGIEQFTGNRPYSIPHPDLRSSYPQGYEGLGMAAEIAPQFAIPGGASLRALKAVNNPYGKALLSSAGAGLTSAAMNEGNRLISGIGGAALGAVPGIISPFRSETIANKLLRDKDKVKALYGNKYSNLFNQAEKKGINEVEIPDIDLDVIAGSGMPKYRKALHKFVDNPSLENAHWAQSELGGLERNLDKVASNSGLTATQNQAYNEAVKAKEAIKKSMFSGDEHLSNLYDVISQGYKDNVVPWNTVKGLEDFRKGELTAADLTKQLLSNKKFKAQLLDKYPSLKVNALARNKYIQGALLGGFGLDAAHKIYKATE